MQLGSTLGANLVCGSIVAILYGAMCLQCYSYFQRAHKTRSRFLGYSVLLLWALGTAHMVFVECDMYLNLVANFGDVEKVLNVTFWPTPALEVITLVTTLFVQSWYCHRLWVLSSKNALLTYFLIVVIFASFSLGMASVIEIVMLKNFANFHAVVWMSLACVSLTTFADFYISSALCYFIYKERKYVRSRMGSLLNTIIVYTVSINLITGLVSVSYIITNFLLPDTWVYVGEYMIFCGLYCNSLLAWINARDSVRERLDCPTTGVAATVSPSSVMFAPAPASRSRSVPIDTISIVRAESTRSERSHENFDEKSTIRFSAV
ncbi:hypothetical protein PsYK624_156940 [Phanerochaete sordida]|uniref:DUF6534 domain-containing protein n=1 Tax=Phanerochaete sordida TaxID=48140 RepID=A0A9P3LMJ9_9APHY|nr:hypothetical protein PsYK624_156940 [Phanerochaete sordida]